MIYKFAIHNNGIAADQLEYGSGIMVKNTSVIQQPNLLRSCRLMRAEGLCFFFEIGTFHFLVNSCRRVSDGEKILKALVRWLKRADATAKACMQKFQITFRGRLDKAWVMYIDYFLKKLSWSTSIHLHFIRQGPPNEKRVRHIWKMYQSLKSGRLPSWVEPQPWYWPSAEQKFEGDRTECGLLFPARSDRGCRALEKATGGDSQEHTSVILPESSDSKNVYTCGNCGCQVT